MCEEIHLQHEDLALGLLPQKGGCLTYFRKGDIDVLRPWGGRMSSDAVQNFDPLKDAACFPMLPFTNRIQRGCFSWREEQITLARNWDGDENAIHGNAWQSKWFVEYITAKSCKLGFENSSGWWPWDYKAEMEVFLDANGFQLSLTMRNLDNRPMPAGIGLHPYFPKQDDTELQFNYNSVSRPFEEEALDSAGQMNPICLDFSNSKRFPRETIDHSYSGVGPTAIIRYPKDSRCLALNSSHNVTHSMTYSPESEEFFCYEPTTHSAGAFNMTDPIAGGVVELQQDEELQLNFDVREFEISDEVSLLMQ